MFISYFATWVPIITSPSFMRTLLKGLEREKNEAVFKNVCSIHTKFCSIGMSSFLPHVRVNTKKHSFQEDLCDNHKKTNLQSRESYVFIDWLWVSQENIKWLKMLLPPSLGSGSSSTFSSKSLSFGKPSKCFVRIHVLAWTMILCFRGNFWFWTKVVKSHIRSNNRKSE